MQAVSREKNLAMFGQIYLPIRRTKKGCITDVHTAGIFILDLLYYVANVSLFSAQELNDRLIKCRKWLNIAFYSFMRKKSVSIKKTFCKNGRKFKMRHQHVAVHRRIG